MDCAAILLFVVLPEKLRFIFVRRALVPEETDCAYLHEWLTTIDRWDYPYMANYSRLARSIAIYRQLK